MENHVVTLPSKKIREIARIALEGKWPHVVLFFLLFMLFDSGVGMVLDLFFSSTRVLPVEDPLTGEYVTTTITYGSSIYGFLVGGPLTWGLSKYLIDFFRNKVTNCSTLFEGFSHFGKAFVLTLLTSVKIFLWSMLFVIPGIVAAYKYSQAFFVLIDHPEYTANQCIKESCRIMSGNKFKLLCLQFSFIGWYMLASFPAAFLPAIDGVFGIFMFLLFSIPSLFVDAYSQVANVVFYDLACDNLVIMEDEEQPALEE